MMTILRSAIKAEYQKIFPQVDQGYALEKYRTRDSKEILHSLLFPTVPKAERLRNYELMRVELQELKQDFSNNIAHTTITNRHSILGTTCILESSSLFHPPQIY